MGLKHAWRKVFLECRKTLKVTQGVVQRIETPADTKYINVSILSLCEDLYYLYRRLHNELFTPQNNITLVKREQKHEGGHSVYFDSSLFTFLHITENKHKYEYPMIPYSTKCNKERLHFAEVMQFFFLELRSHRAQT